MGKLLNVISLTLLLAGIVRCDDKHARADEALRRTLMENYNSLSLPNTKTNVNLTGMDVRGFRLMPEDRTMKIHGWVKFTWNDPRLTWKPEEHLDIQYLAMDPNSIWLPDLTLYNSVSTRNTVIRGIAQPLAYPNGRVLFVPACDMKFMCIMDMTYWPHDVHNCSIKFGSWVHSALVMDLVLDNYDVEVPPHYELDTNDDNETLNEFTITDWGVQRHEKYYDCCSEPYVSVVTYLILKRNAPAYTWTVKVPVVCLCLLTLVLFMLPPAAAEKVVFGGFCLLLNFLYMYYVNSEIKHTPAQTPLIVQLLGVQLMLVIVCLFLSAYVLRMARGPHTYGLPEPMRAPVANLAGFLCLSSYVNPDLSKTNDLETGSGKVSPYSVKSENSGLSDWIMVSAVVDRIAFIVYLAICVISLIRFNGVL